MSWTYTQAKKIVETMFDQGDFSPSTAYKLQSPFNESRSYPSISSWDIWYNILENYSFTLKKSSKIAVLFNIETVLMLIEDYGIPAKQISLLSDNNNKTALARSWGVNVIYNNEDLPKMQFTHVIKNPPWDQGIYTKFWPLAEHILATDGYQLDILPTNWMTLSSFEKDRDYVLNKFEIQSIRIYDNSKGQVFEAQPGGDVIVMVSRKTETPNNTLVEWTYYDNSSFTVDLNKHKIWPMYTSALSVKILDMVVSKKINNLQWDRNPPSNYFVSAPTKVHRRVDPNFMKNPGSRWELNILKGITDEQKFYFNDAQSAQLHHEWFSTDAFAYILALVKSQGKNQPHPIAYTGEHSFINNNFVNYFGFTKQHLEEIQQWKSKA
jgi:hypothetical protein